MLFTVTTKCFKASKNASRFEKYHDLISISAFTLGIFFLNSISHGDESE